MDRGVFLAGTVGEPVPCWPRRCGRLVGRLGNLGCLLTREGERCPQAGPMPRHAPLCGFAEVVPKVNTVGDLESRRRPGSGVLGEEWRTVATNHLDSRTFAEPGCERCRFTIRQQVHWPAGLDVDQHCPVDPAPAHCVFVDTNYPRSLWPWPWEGIDQPQHCAAADRDPEDTCHAGPSSAGKRKADLGQCRPQPVGPPAMPTGQPRELLSKRSPFARSIRADETPDMQTQHHAPPALGRSAGNRR